MTKLENTKKYKFLKVISNPDVTTVNIWHQSI